MDQSFNISKLIVKALRQAASAEEREILDRWIQESEENRALFDRLSSSHGSLLDHVDLYQQLDATSAFEQVSERAGETRVVSMKPGRYLRYAASILLPVLVSAGMIYYFMFRTPADPLAGIDDKIVPGIQQATLTLADGSTVNLKESGPANLVNQGTAVVKKENTGLVYSSGPSAPGQKGNKEVIYNELTTPFGGRYRVTLSDGTTVTLNAGSNLRYPVTFSDSTRTVYLAGEAYFDVTTTGTPFIVSGEQQNIRVLGTQFNVSAYSNEALITTTLVEGKVRIESGEDRLTLDPGKQAILNKTKSTLRIESVNTALYTSWIDGKFEFNKDNMDVVIKRLSRWYDFDYEFENDPAKDYHFTGRVDCEQPISSILQMLEASADIQFELKENIIIIK